jgi:hypothetical protein
MRPTGNAQGNYYFFSLSTGRIINRAHATKLPMPDDVIERMHALVRRQKANPGLVFLDRNQAPYDALDEDDDDDADDDDSDYVPGDDEDGSGSEQDDGEDDDDDDYVPDGDDSDSDPDDDFDSDDDDDSLEYDSDDGSVGSNTKNPPGGGDDEESVEPGEVHPDDEGGTTGVGAKVAEDAGSVDSDDDKPPAESTGVEPHEGGHSNEAGGGQGVLERDMEARYGPRTERFNMR